MGYTPNEIAIFHRDHDQQNHWVQWGTNHFQTNPIHGHLGAFMKCAVALMMFESVEVFFPHPFFQVSHWGWSGDG